MDPGLAEDYIKQLQLSKQIEQKAKEAAKNRKTAEDKLEEAEKAIELMRSFGAQSSEAEKHFVEAREAFKGKDYKLVLSHSTKTIEGCHQTCRDRIEEVLRSATSLLDLGKDRVIRPAADEEHDLQRQGGRGAGEVRAWLQHRQGALREGGPAGEPHRGRGVRRGPVQGPLP